MSQKPHKDSQGQIGGPTDAEQARVDAEQKAFMEQRTREAAPVREAEERTRQAKIEQAVRAIQQQKDTGKALIALADELKAVKVRLAALEKK